MADALRGQLGRRGHPVADARPAGSRSPGPGRRRGPGHVLGLERLARAAQGGELVLDLGTALAQRALVGDLRLERRAQLEQVVGQQPEPGVALVGLDDGRPPGHLGLLAERLELAAELTVEVLDAA